MFYVSGTPALNLPDELTPGDWHFSSVDWEHVKLWDSDKSFWGEWGISEKVVPGKGLFPVANHLRACLDLVAEGYFSSAADMREHFIADDTYNEEIFSRVIQLASTSRWKNIDAFMGKEYTTAWLRFKESIHALPT